MSANRGKGNRKIMGQRKRYGLRRLSRNRPPLPVVVVVCDDTKTAPAYFKELKREVKEKVTLRVESANCRGALPLEVVRIAHELLKEVGATSENDENDKQSVWAIIDCEGDVDRQRQAVAAKKRGKKENVHVALSMPCFEVWTLAHLIDTGETFQNCQAVLTRLRREWREQFKNKIGPKAQADYSKLNDCRREAIERAKKHASEKDQSWTEVWKVVEEVLDLFQNST